MGDGRCALPSRAHPHHFIIICVSFSRCAALRDRACRAYLATPASSKPAQCRKCAQSARCEPGLGRGRPIGSSAAKCEQTDPESD